MDRLKRILAIPMGLSAAAALWLLYRQAGTSAVLLGIVAIAVLLALLVGAGRQQRRGRGALWALPAALAAAAVLTMILPRTTAATAGSPAGVDGWSEAKVEHALQQGRPVFVFFTADWCLTCKVNEAAAIDQTEVRDAFRKAGVTVLEADWTNGDPAITRFLESRGRAGVPFYLWYMPGREPEELPQVLTPAMLVSRAQQAKR
jgi:thiol:disulfide interchange protein